jgi:YD repeat-containing protein
MSVLKYHSAILMVLVVIGIAIFAADIALSDIYTYDQYGRLTGVSYSDGSSVTYTYDDAGNRTVVTQTPP